MNGPEAALAVCRFVHDGAGLLLWGAFAYLAALVPRDLARAVGQQLNAVRIWATVLSVLATFAALPIAVAGIGDGWADALDSRTVTAVVFQTSVGWAWQMQMIAALPLLAALRLPGRWQRPATAAAAGCSLATLALAGHAAMNEGWLGAAHRLNDATHVLAGGAWLGALVPLLVILRALGTPAWRREAVIALHRFSTAGHAAVALVIATGAVNTLLVLGRWPVDPASPYQALLAAKIGLVVVMTMLAVANRYVVAPRIAKDPTGSLRALRIGTRVEIALGLAAVGSVSVFGLLEPV